jgi:hypothetical protein
MHVVRLGSAACSGMLCGSQACSPAAAPAAWSQAGSGRPAAAAAARCRLRPALLAAAPLLSPCTRPCTSLLHKALPPLLPFTLRSSSSPDLRKMVHSAAALKPADHSLGRPSMRPGTTFLMTMPETSMPRRLGMRICGKKWAGVKPQALLAAAGLASRPAWALSMASSFCRGT